MIIKICGITTANEAEYLNKVKIDLAGMVFFFEKSKRNITIDKAKEIMKTLDDKIKTVAVVVSPTIDQIEEIENAGFDYIQIHGEMPEGIFDKTDIGVLKAFNVNDMEMYDEYSKISGIKGFVFDAAEPGSGKTFDWNSIKDIKRNEKMFILAGGLNPYNVAEAIEMVKPDGVDVSSGVEKEDGVGKDEEKIIEFVRKARK